MKEEILKKVDILYDMYKQGSLGGEFMPYKPIDIHTALWLWNRNGFKELEK